MNAPREQGPNSGGGQEEGSSISDLRIEGEEERLLPEEVLGELAWLERLSRRLAGDPHLADDLLQSTVAVALERPPLRQQVRGWLRMVLTNLLNDELRRRVRDSDRLARQESEASLDAPSAADLAERATLQLEIGKEVMSLDPELRDIVLWHFYGELSSAAISRRTDLSEAQVRRRLKQALELLRHRLDEHALSNGAKDARTAREGWIGLLLLGAGSTVVAPAAKASSSAVASSGSAGFGGGAAIAAWAVASALLAGAWIWVLLAPAQTPAAHWVPEVRMATERPQSASELLVRAAEPEAFNARVPLDKAPQPPRLSLVVSDRNGGEKVPGLQLEFVDFAGRRHQPWHSGESQGTAWSLGPRTATNSEPARGMGWLVAQAPGYRLVREPCPWPPADHRDELRIWMDANSRIEVDLQLPWLEGSTAELGTPNFAALTMLTLRSTSRPLTADSLRQLPDDPADACAAWTPLRLGVPSQSAPLGFLERWSDAPFWVHLCIGEYPLLSQRVVPNVQRVEFTVSLAMLEHYRPVTARLVDAFGQPVLGRVFISATGRSSFLAEADPTGRVNLNAPPGEYWVECTQARGQSHGGQRLQARFPRKLDPKDPDTWDWGDIALVPRPDQVPIKLVCHDGNPPMMAVEKWTATKQGPSRSLFSEWRLEGDPSHWSADTPRVSARLHAMAPRGFEHLETLGHSRRVWWDYALAPVILDPDDLPERLVLNLHRARSVSVAVRSMPWQFASYELRDAEGWVIDGGRLISGWLRFGLAPGDYRLKLLDPTAPAGQALPPLERSFRVADGPLLLTL